MAEELVAVHGAVISCPNAIPGVPNYLTGTCDVETTGTENSILTSSDSVLGTNILPFAGCSLFSCGICTPIPKRINTQSNIYNADGFILTKGSYFTCLAKGKETKVEIVEPNQESIHRQCSTPKCPKTLEEANEDERFKPYVSGDAKNRRKRERGQNIFHCGYEGKLENCNTAISNKSQQECVYDESGVLVDKTHERANCRGTENKCDGDTEIACHIWHDIIPYFIPAGLESLEKRVDDKVEDAGKSIGELIDYTGDSFVVPEYWEYGSPPFN